MPPQTGHLDGGPDSQLSSLPQASPQPQSETYHGVIVPPREIEVSEARVERLQDPNVIDIKKLKAFWCRFLLDPVHKILEAENKLRHSNISGSRRSELQLRMQQDLAWLKTSNFPTSFVATCERLERDPQQIRRKIQELRQRIQQGSKSDNEQLLRAFSRSPEDFLTDPRRITAGTKILPKNKKKQRVQRLDINPKE